MIQRIQSLYLFMTSVISIIFLKGVYLTFFDKSGTHLNLAMTGLYRIAENGALEQIGVLWFITIPGLIIPALSMITVFMYKRRDLQLILVRILMLFVIAFLAASIIYIIFIIARFETNIDNWYKLLIPVIQLVLVILAFRGVKKDDDLVKSYDRLR